MLEKSFGLYFYLKQSKNEKNASRYVYMRITVDGKSTELSTKRLWNQERWNGSAGRTTGNKEDARNLNSYLETLSAKVYQAKKKLVETDKDITAETLKKVLLGTDEAKRMVLEIFNYHNQQVAALVGGEYAPGTLQRFQTTLDHTRSFIQWKYGVIDLEIKDLDFEFISEFSFWFKSVRKCSHNTTVKYLATFKKIVIRCVKKGWLLRDPFAGFKLAKKEIHKDSRFPFHSLIFQMGNPMGLGISIFK